MNFFLGGALKRIFVHHHHAEAGLVCFGALKVDRDLEIGLLSAQVLASCVKKFDW